jgi:transcriptional regulator with XRE-family HTH domain
VEEQCAKDGGIRAIIICSDKKNQVNFICMENMELPKLAKIHYMDFYTRVKRLSKEKRLSLQELIISTGLNHASYYSLQRDGNLPRADEALAIAQALGTTVEFLLLGIEPENRVKTILDDFQSVIDRYKKPLKETRKH